MTEYRHRTATRYFACFFNNMKGNALVRLEAQSLSLSMSSSPERSVRTGEPAAKGGNCTGRAGPSLARAQCHGAGAAKSRAGWQWWPEPAMAQPARCIPSDKAGLRLRQKFKLEGQDQGWNQAEALMAHSFRQSISAPPPDYRLWQTLPLNHRNVECVKNNLFTGN